MNEALWLGFALLDLTMVLVVYRYFGRAGLFALIGFNLILCNIQVLKTIELFGLTTTLGNVLYASIFLASDLLNEHYGKEQAKRGVLIGFLFLLMATGYMQIALLFSPAPDDFANPHMEVIFGFLPRVALASMAAYLVSQLHDVWAFNFWKKKTKGKHLWFRNTASTLVSQILDSVIFCLIAFLGVFPFEVLLEILLTTYIFKVIVATLDTPFMYLARRFRPTDAPVETAT
jgi:queuosine precursor transporter